MKMITVKNIKDITISTLLLLLLCLHSSCEKFLDAKPSSKLDRMSPEFVQELLDDYDTMNKGYPGDIEILSDDYFLLESGWAGVSIRKEDQAFYLWKPEAQRITLATGWQDPYKVVYNANLALETLNENKGQLDEQNVNILKGTALFFRAYAFFQLAQSFAKPFDPTTSNQDPGIPIRKTTALEEKSVRGTVQQTYDQIINDFQQSIVLLPATTPIKSRPNKAAAYAALARTYLAMEDYPNALQMASECLKIYSTLIDYNTISKTSLTPFPRFNDEVIFQSTLLAGLPPNPTRGKINRELYASYATNDLRKVIFFKPSALEFRFSGNYEPVTSSVFFNGLATDEIYLIRAECYARAGNIPAAIADLNTLLSKRWVTGSYVNMTATTAEEALRKVLSERRKELIFRGLRWTDLRRLNRDPRFKVTLSRTIAGESVTVPPDDRRYVLLIPQPVIDNSGIPQNPR